MISMLYGFYTWVYTDCILTRHIASCVKGSRESFYECCNVLLGGVSVVFGVGLSMVLEELVL